MRVCIAIDCMSGDHGAPVAVEAVLQAQQQDPLLMVFLVGDEALISAELLRLQAEVSAMRVIVPASQIVRMEDDPRHALRKKRDSSMRVAIDLVHRERAHACVSSGNTGALMATARFVLKMLPGISRPAIATKLPAVRGWSYVLDLGANVDCSAQHLLQFAKMGSALVAAVEDRPAPSVALLNVGTEALKGCAIVREAAQLLELSPLNFVGYVEGNNIFWGDIDVIVCDGFVGNSVLKSVEGFAKMVSTFMKEGFAASLPARLRGLVARPVLGALSERLDHRSYNGASLLGLNGVIVKSHGSADVVSFRSAIRRAVLEIRHQRQLKLKRLLSQELNTVADPCLLQE